MRLSYVNGILAIVFGSLALFLPNITIAVLSIYFAIALILGGIALVVGSRERKDAVTNWHVFQIEGIIGILVGIMILIKPVPAATFFTIIIGLWALFIGVILLFTYFRKRMQKAPNITHLIGGVLSLIFGLLILLNPFESLRAITILIGLYAIAYGIISIIHTSKIYLK
jgi:uncharacterized membrane protein HdeD (DUF308 family)